MVFNNNNLIKKLIKLKESLQKIILQIAESEKSDNIMSQSSPDENGPLALLNLLWQNNFQINNLNFLENRQNELSRLVNFISVLISLNIQIKDLDHVKEILNFFQNLSKIDNNNLENLLKNNIFTNEENEILNENYDKENVFEKPLESNEKNLFKEKENLNLSKEQKAMKNSNSMSTISQEQKTDNSLQKKVFPYVNNNLNNNNILIENKNFEDENEENSSEKSFIESNEYDDGILINL